MASVEVSGLRVYPVKSLRPMMPASATVEKRGLKHDRRWMVTDPEGMFRTRREIPTMAQINAVTDDSHITLSREGMDSVTLPLEPQGKTIDVQIWDAITTGDLVSPTADEWLTAAIGEPSQ